MIVCNNMFVLLEKFDANPRKPYYGRRFLFFFDSILDVQDGNPTIKKKSLAKLIKLMTHIMTHMIYGVGNTKSKQFTFAQNHSSGFIQRRLDYMFISNTLKEFVTMTETMTPISTN